MKEIFEVGVIKNGLSIIQETYLKPDELKEINSLLISGFIQVLNDFIDMNFNNLPETLQMENFSAYFHTVTGNNQGDQVIFYAFCNKNIKYSTIRPILEKVALISSHIIFTSNLNALSIKEKSDLEEIFSTEIKKYNEDTSYRSKLSKF